MWLVIAAAETLHGIVRGAVLQPFVGDRPARQIGVVVGSGLILAIAWLFSGWLGAGSQRARLEVGVLWLALMLAFEVSLGRALGLSWQRIASDYDPRQGGLMPIGMTVLVLAPLVAGWLRGAAGRAAGGA